MYVDSADCLGVGWYGDGYGKGLCGLCILGGFITVASGSGTVVAAVVDICT